MSFERGRHRRARLDEGTSQSRHNLGPGYGAGEAGEARGSDTAAVSGSIEENPRCGHHERIVFGPSRPEGAAIPAPAQTGT